MEFEFEDWLDLYEVIRAELHIGINTLIRRRDKIFPCILQGKAK